VVVGDYGTLLTSTDGINWTQRTDNSLIVDKLNDTMYDGLYYYAVGSNATIIRSSDSITWNSVSLLTPAEPDSVITGDDFLYGYGPEELIPGIITELLSLKVTTSPGSSWDNTPDIPQETYYENTGFGMKSVTSTTNTANFNNLLKTPATVSVFLLDSTTELGNRIYTGYTVNWITKTVTLTGSLPVGKLLMVEVYEVGNGKQTSRGNSQITPLRINPFTGYSEIYINKPFTPLITFPVAYHNGVKLLFQVDYDVIYAEDTNLTRIEFAALYNQETDYITWAILDTSIGDFRIDEVSYSIPETQLVTGSTSNTCILTNNIGRLNINNAIVEKNGIRLQPIDYSIDFASSTLTLVSNPLSSDTIAVTTFNETDRLFIQTIQYTATAGQTIFVIPQIAEPTVTPVYYTDVNKLWVTVNGERVSSSKLSYGSYYQIFTRSTDKTKIIDSFVTINSVVKKNGIPLVKTTDYTLNLITSELILISDILTSDVIEIFVFNNLTFDSALTAGDVVIVTVTVDGITPNSTTFQIDVDKYGQSKVYRSNDGDGTWLTKDFNLGDPTIYVNDIETLMDTVVQDTTLIVNNNGMLIAHLECDVNLVKKITVYNNTSSTTVTNYILKVIDGRSVIVFEDDSQASFGDSLTATMKIGNTIELNEEKIRFSQANFTENTISGLVRGVLGTSPVQASLKYDIIYGITRNRTLEPQYYGVIWNTSNYQEKFGDPLQISTSPAATFLQYGHY
jgi:hypothetical protein